MSVFVDKDQSGRISLMEMSYGEAEVLLQALRFYFESRWLHTKSPEEREIKRLNKKYRGHIALYILNQKLCLWKQMSVTKIKN